MKYTVGIPAFNEQNTLLLVLESIYQQVRHSIECYHLVVVVNGSTDDTRRVALDFGNTNWGTPTYSNQDQQQHWYFYSKKLSFSVIDIPIAQKSLAVNIIHGLNDSDVVLLFDADVVIGQGVIAEMSNAFEQNPDHGVIAASYSGHIAHPNWSANPLLELARITVCHFINHFDSFCPRLDGKACGYRRNLVEQHPSIVAADTWLEGIAWQQTAGCIYLRAANVSYRFPATFGDLVNQYVRYAQSARTLMLKHPSLLELIKTGRAHSQPRGRSPHIMARAIGWLFFTLVNIWARYLSSIEPSNGREVDIWEPIQSTKY